MAADTDRPPLPDVLLERYRLGELPAVQMGEIAARLRDDAGSRARLDAIDEDDRAQRANGLPHLIATGVRNRQHARADATRAPRWQTVSVAAAGATLLVAIVALLLRPPVTPVPAGTDDGDRIKGTGPAIVAFRKVGDTSETLHDGDRAHQRDVIRLGYQAAGRAFGVIVSFDGRGAVTLHLPAGGTRASALAADGRVLLDSAYELDDAPRWERFCLVTGASAFDVAPVLDAARAAANAGRTSFAVDGLDVNCLTLRKD